MVAKDPPTPASDWLLWWGTVDGANAANEAPSGFGSWHREGDQRSRDMGCVRLSRSCRSPGRWRFISASSRRGVGRERWSDPTRRHRTESRGDQYQRLGTHRWGSIETGRTSRLRPRRGQSQRPKPRRAARRKLSSVRACPRGSPSLPCQRAKHACDAGQSPKPRWEDREPPRQFRLSSQHVHAKGRALSLQQHLRRKAPAVSARANPETHD